MTTHKWQFTSRFRRQAYGWNSKAPIARIKEAISEIKQVGKKDPVLAAEGAVHFLEKISPAIEQVDSSSGAIGAAVNRAIDALAAIIAKPVVDTGIRQKWLERLWVAFENDEIPYIESLGDYWGQLCATPEMASVWADQFLSLREMIRKSSPKDHPFFNAMSACLSCLFTAGRYEELLTLLESEPYPFWTYRQWGMKALVSMGKKAEAIRYAEESRGQNVPAVLIAQTCEAILISSGMLDEAYRRYAVEANQATTHLSTFRAIAKKYPQKSPDAILRDLIAGTPGSEGKWFAAAKDAGLFDIAIALVKHSPTDPRTFIRASRDYAKEQPMFALESGLAALYWIAEGHGYEITGTDIRDAYSAVMQAAVEAEVGEVRIKERIREMLVGDRPAKKYVREMLSFYL